MLRTPERDVSYCGDLASAQSENVARLSHDIGAVAVGIGDGKRFFVLIIRLGVVAVALQYHSQATGITDSAQGRSADSEFAVLPEEAEGAAGSGVLSFIPGGADKFTDRSVLGVAVGVTPSA